MCRYWPSQCMRQFRRTGITSNLKMDYKVARMPMSHTRHLSNTKQRRRTQNQAIGAPSPNDEETESTSSNGSSAQTRTAARTAARKLMTVLLGGGGVVFTRPKGGPPEGNLQDTIDRGSEGYVSKFSIR